MTVPQSIREFLMETLGQEEGATGKGAINQALRAVMKRRGFQDLSAYEKHFLSSPEEQQMLIDEIVVGETWFFRDWGPFAYLALQAQDLRKALAPGGMLKILSAPCSSGEEPYSIVMALLQAGLPPAAFSVDAADISAKVLNMARKGCYGRNAFRESLGEGYASYFTDTDQGRQVTDIVSRQVRFIRDNLAASPCLDGYGPYHIIFCRNFLIYLTSEARQRVFKHLDRLLLPGGALFSGHAETMFWQMNGYRPIRHERAFAFSKPDPSAPAHAVKQERVAETSAKFPTRHCDPKPRAKRGGHPLDLREIATDPEGPLAMAASVSSSMDSSATLRQGQWLAMAGERDMKKDSLDRQLREARLLADRGALDEAASLCRDYEKVAGPVAEAYCLMGLICEARKDVRLAEDYFLKALYLDPYHYESLIHTSLLYQERGDERRAALYRERAERSRGGTRGPKA